MVGLGSVGVGIVIAVAGFVVATAFGVGTTAVFFAVAAKNLTRMEACGLSSFTTRNCFACVTSASLCFRESEKYCVYCITISAEEACLLGHLYRLYCCCCCCYNAFVMAASAVLVRMIYHEAGSGMGFSCYFFNDPSTGH